MLHICDAASHFFCFFFLKRGEDDERGLGVEAKRMTNGSRAQLVEWPDAAVIQKVAGTMLESSISSLCRPERHFMRQLSVGPAANPSWWLSPTKDLQNELQKGLSCVGAVKLYVGCLFHTTKKLAHHISTLILFVLQECSEREILSWYKKSAKKRGRVQNENIGVT